MRVFHVNLMVIVLTRVSDMIGLLSCAWQLRETKTQEHTQHISGVWAFCDPCVPVAPQGYQGPWTLWTLPEVSVSESDSHLLHFYFLILFKILKFVQCRFSAHNRNQCLQQYPSMNP